MAAVELHRLTSRVYASVSTRPGGPNRGFIRCDEGWIAVDAPSPEDSRADLAFLRQVSAQAVQGLVVTHHHSDHWFGAQAFDCELIASDATVAQMRDAGTAYLHKASHYHGHLALDRQAVRLVYPSRVFRERLVLPLSPPVEIIRLGGHTPGTSVVWVPSEGALFASDLVFVGIHPYLKGADLETWLSALKHIITMDGVGKLVPGHGAVATLAAVHEQTAYLKRFVVRLRQLKEAGASKEEVAATPQLLGLPDLHRPQRLSGSVRWHWERI